MPHYTRGDVRIRYEEAGSGFPLLTTPGGGLNSIVTGWPSQVFDAMALFSDDFRCITMDQRNASGGESSGPVDVDDPWGALADDQLGVMDHLGIDKFLFMGYCIGGPFALKLIERAPDRVVAAVLCQPVGHASKTPDAMYDSGHRLGSGSTRKRRPDVSQETIDQYVHNLYRVQPDFMYSVSRDFARVLPDAAAGAAGRHAGAFVRGGDGPGGACAQRAGDRVPLEGVQGHLRPDHRAGARVPAGAQRVVA